MFKKFAKLIYVITSNVMVKNKCIVEKGSVLYPESEIVNNMRDKNRIIIGRNCHIRGQLLIYGHGGRIKMGNYCYVGRNTYIWSGKKISMGNRVLVSHNCNIFDNDTHPLDPKRRAAQFKNITKNGQPKAIDLKDKSVVIEDDVLIGANTIILKGTRIGKCAVVAAGSVVTKNVAPYTIVAGNPARFVKRLSLIRNNV